MNRKLVVLLSSLPLLNVQGQIVATTTALPASSLPEKEDVATLEPTQENAPAQELPHEATTENPGSTRRYRKRRRRPASELPQKPVKTTKGDSSLNTDRFSPEELELLEELADLPIADQIVATVYGQEGSVAVTLSETRKMGLDNRKKTRDDVILEQLMFLEALRYNVKIDDKVIDRYIIGMKRMHNLSDKDIEAIFAGSGYTMEDGREQLRIMNAVQSLLDFKIKARLIISEKDIQTFHELNPIVQEAAYQLQRVFIPFDPGMEKEEQRTTIAAQIKNGHPFKWGIAHWRDQSELPEHRRFVTTMKVGDISDPIETEGGFELILLKDLKAERTQSLEERRNEIINLLKLPEYERQMAEYKKHLLDSASIIYFDTP